MRCVALIGFMGAGKTTVGRALARRLHWKFRDLDAAIERHARQRVAEIFAKRGETWFRRVETLALQDLLQDHGSLSDLVLALGGGAFIQPQNRRLLKEAGAVTVLLEAPLEELRRRCQKESKVRPLAQQEAGFAELFAARRAEYERARFRVQTLGKPVEQVAAEVAQLLTEVLKVEVEK
ncbi:MAG TPA: shikimate kinase [Candidatus Angelobacter sp.]|nr:shikimate kinase [Candidatus Angelobacter sp.]